VLVATEHLRRDEGGVRPNAADERGRRAVLKAQSDEVESRRVGRDPSAMPRTSVVVEYAQVDQP
jgi:hypothetical protein